MSAISEMREKLEEAQDKADHNIIHNKSYPMALLHLTTAISEVLTQLDGVEVMEGFVTDMSMRGGTVYVLSRSEPENHDGPATLLIAKEPKESWLRQEAEE